MQPTLLIVPDTRAVFHLGDCEAFEDTYAIEDIIDGGNSVQNPRVSLQFFSETDFPLRIFLSGTEQNEIPTQLTSVAEADDAARDISDDDDGMLSVKLSSRKSTWDNDFNSTAGPDPSPQKPDVIRSDNPNEITLSDLPHGDPNIRESLVLMTSAIGITSTEELRPPTSIQMYENSSLDPPPKSFMLTSMPGSCEYIRKKSMDTKSSEPRHYLRNSAEYRRRLSFVQRSSGIETTETEFYLKEALQERISVDDIITWFQCNCGQKGCFSHTEYSVSRPSQHMATEIHEKYIDILAFLLRIRRGNTIGVILADESLKTRSRDGSMTLDFSRALLKVSKYLVPPTHPDHKDKMEWLRYLHWKYFPIPLYRGSHEIGNEKAVLPFSISPNSKLGSGANGSVYRAQLFAGYHDFTPDDLSEVSLLSFTVSVYDSVSMY